MSITLNEVRALTERGMGPPGSAAEIARVADVLNRHRNHRTTPDASDRDLLRAIAEKRATIGDVRLMIDQLRLAGDDTQGTDWRRKLTLHLATFERLVADHDAFLAEALDRALPIPAWASHRSL